MKYIKWLLLIVALISILYIGKEFFARNMMVKIDDNLSIEYIRPKNGMTLTFGSGGINQITSIESFENYENIFRQVLKRPNRRFITTTDWIGPIIFSTLDNVGKQRQEAFTGGWHGLKEGEDQVPTATETGRRIFVDEQLITKKGNFVGQKVTLEVTNQINAYNSQNRFSLEETVTYTIHPNKEIQVRVSLKALEAIRVSRYYGMQVILPPGYEHISYIRKGNVIGEFNQLEETYNAAYTPVDLIVISDKIEGNNIYASINLESDINNFLYKKDEEPYAFTTNDRKSYFNIINGIPLYLNQGEVFEWEGMYRFD